MRPVPGRAEILRKCCVHARFIKSVAASALSGKIVCVMMSGQFSCPSASRRLLPKIVVDSVRVHRIEA
jgi:hypothetical protein